jgi:hypothetical protein
MEYKYGTKRSPFYFFPRNKFSLSNVSHVGAPPSLLRERKRQVPREVDVSGEGTCLPSWIPWSNMY